MSYLIITKQGDEVLVDEDDYVELNEYEWRTIKRSKTSIPYVGRSIDFISASGKEYKKILWMHRYVTDAPKGIHVHHINGNPFDNCKSNLKLMTQEEHFSFHNHNKVDKSWKLGKSTSVVKEMKLIREELIFETRDLLLKIKWAKITRVEYQYTGYKPPEPNRELPDWMKNPKLELW